MQRDAIKNENRVAVFRKDLLHLSTTLERADAFLDPTNSLSASPEEPPKSEASGSRAAATSTGLLGAL